MDAEENSGLWSPATKDGIKKGRRNQLNLKGLSFLHRFIQNHHGTEEILC